MDKTKVHNLAQAAITQFEFLWNEDCILVDHDDPDCPDDDTCDCEVPAAINKLHSLLRQIAVGDFDDG